MATQTLPSSLSSSSVPSSRRASVASLKTVNTGADDSSSSPVETNQNFILSPLPTNGVSGTLRTTAANDRFLNAANVVALPMADLRASPPPILVNHSWSDFHHASTNDNLTAADVSNQFSQFVKNGGQVSVGALSEEAYEEQLAREREKKAAAEADEENSDASRYLPRAGATAAAAARAKKHSFWRLRRIKFRGEDEEKRRQREDEERRQREEEEARKREEEAKKKGDKPGEERPGEERAGERPSGERPGETRASDVRGGEKLDVEAVAARDAAAGVRDTAAGARDTAAGLRDATVGVRDATVATRDVAAVAKDISSASRVAVEGASVVRDVAVGGTLLGGGLALAGGLAVGTVLFTGGLALVGGLAAAGLVAYVTKSKDKSFGAFLKTTGNLLVPPEAREAFSQGHILKGLDETLGVSSTIHLVKNVAHATWGAIKDPVGAWASIKSFAGKAAQYAGLAGQVLSNSHTRQDAMRIASGLLTSDGSETQATSDFLNDATKDKSINTRMTALLPGAFGAVDGPANENAPSPVSNGGRRRDHIAIPAGEPVRPTNLATNGAVLAPHAA